MFPSVIINAVLTMAVNDVTRFNHSLRRCFLTKQNALYSNIVMVDSEPISCYYLSAIVHDDSKA